MQKTYDDGSHRNDPGGWQPRVYPAGSHPGHPEQAETPSEPPELPDDYDASYLMDLPPAPLKWLIPGLVPRDAHILAGGPKAGKSRLMQMCALKVATSQPDIGPPPKVLYISPDDTDHDGWNEKLNDLAAGAGVEPGRFIVWFGSKARPVAKLKGGLIEQIEAKLDADPAIVWVIIDVLNSVRPDAKAAGEDNPSVHGREHATTRSLTELSERRGIGLTLLNHTSKSISGDNPFEKSAGSNGQRGGMPTEMALVEVSAITDERILYMRGRRVPVARIPFRLSELAIDWDLPPDVTETLEDLEAEMQLAAQEREQRELRRRPHTPGPIEQKIQDALEAGVTLLGAIAEATELRPVIVRVYLGRMVNRGNVTREGRGVYRPCYIVTSVTFGNSPAQEPSQCNNVTDVTPTPVSPPPPAPVTFAYAWGGRYMPAPREACHICGAQHWENVGDGVYCGSRRCAGRTAWRGPQGAEAIE